MSKKLNNVKAVRELLDGTHKFQTKSQIALGNEKEYETHKVGDVWEDKDKKTGVVYIIEQKDGFVVKKLKTSDQFKKIREDLKSFPNCPKETCTCVKQNHLDKKMWKFHGMCYDCVIDMEHQLKITGKFTEYAKEMTKKNAKAWIEQAEQDVDILKKAYTESRKIVKDEYGKFEHIDAQMSVAEFEEKVEKEFKRYKQEFLERAGIKEEDEDN